MDFILFRPTPTRRSLQKSLPYNFQIIPMPGHIEHLTNAQYFNIHILKCICKEKVGIHKMWKMQKGLFRKTHVCATFFVSRLNLMNGISNFHIRLLLIFMHIFQNHSWSVKQCKTFQNLTRRVKKVLLKN